MAEAGKDQELEALMADVAEMEEQQTLSEMQQTANNDIEARGVVSAAGTSLASVAAGTSTPMAEITSVFVSGLDSRTTESDLRMIFSSCGTIKRITVLKDKQTGMPKGSGYVEFEESSAMKKALLKENQSVHGKPIKVQQKRDNVPAFMRNPSGQPARGGLFARGRGARGAAAASNPMTMMMGMMQSMMQQASGSSYAPRGRGYAPRGSFRGRGRGM